MQTPWIKDNQLPPNINHMDIEDIDAILHSNLKDVQQAVESNHRECTMLEIPPYYLYVTQIPTQ